MTVNVLNGQAETFEPKPVNVELRSITGSVDMVVNAYTVDRVTGTSTTNSGLIGEASIFHRLQGNLSSTC